MEYSVYGIKYKDACNLIDELNALGVQSNITQGGISIVPDGTIDFDAMNKICRKYNTKAIIGATPFEEDIMFRR